MTSYHELTAFQRDLLIAIAAVDEEPYGLALKEYLDERYQEPINHSRLYQNLHKLADQGLVSQTEIDSRRTGYWLTETGRDLLVAQADRLTKVCLEGSLAADGGQR